jgi:predicted lysophospholipase L1 biosynthesis ABC-type transport system permease subunit
VVNQAFADRFLARRDPIGALLNAGGEDWITVVGLARTGKYHLLNESPQPLVYFPVEQSWRDAFTLHFSTPDPAALIEPVRKLFRDIDPDLPFLDPRTLEQHMAASLFANRLGGLLLAVFGLLALCLSAIGIYSVMAYTVSRRVREIGLRVALGAASRDVMALIMGYAMKLVAAGLVVGGLLGIAAGALLRNQLFGIRPGDPATWAVITVVLVGVSILASWLPARRALKIDPALALRAE